MKRLLFIIIVVILAAGCEREDRLVSIDVIPSIEAYVGEKIILEVSHSPSNSLAPAIIFNTNNRFVASVNKGGDIVCNHVGTCTIMAATADTRFSTACTVVVKPTVELFDEPVLDFNITKTAVKLKENGKTIVYETAEMLVYQEIKHPVQHVAYQFDENQKLKSATTILSNNQPSRLTDFMTERYERFPSEDTKDLQVWKGNEIEALTKTVADVCFVVYHPFSGKSTCTSAINTIETIRRVL